MAVKQEKQDERAAVNQKAEELLKDYGNSILRMAYAYLHNMSDAEDILQETLIQYLQTAPVLENPAHEKAWLLKVAANLSKNRIDYNRIRQTDELEETLVQKSEKICVLCGRQYVRSRKNNIVPMRLARRILPFAACVVIVVAGLAVPQIRQKIPQKPQKPGEEKPAVEGVYAPQEVASGRKTDGCGGLSGQGYCFAERKSNGSFLCDIWGWTGRDHISLGFTKYLFPAVTGAGG